MTSKSSTLETWYAETDAASTTGILPLQSALNETTLGGTTPETGTYIYIPKGIRAKIWMKKISGAICIVNTFYNLNPSAATNTSYTMPTNADVQVDSDDLVSAGQLEADERRPLILDGANPGTATARVQFKWSQTVAAKSRIAIKIEWSLISPSSEY